MSTAAERMAEYLEATDFGWLDDVTCERLPPGAIGHNTATHILKIDAYCKRVRADHPDLAIDREVMDLLVNRMPISGPLTDAMELSRSGWYGDIDDVVAAVTLGASNQVAAVITAGAFLSQGFDYFGGDGRPLIDGYRYFLPAVAAFGQAAQHADETACTAKWWDREGYVNVIMQPDALYRAIAPGLTERQRRALVGAEWGTQCRSFVFWPLATMLGINTSFLSSDEIAEAQEELQTGIEELESDEPQDPTAMVEVYLEPIHLGYLIGRHVPALMEETAGVAAGDRVRVAEITARNAWIEEWRQESWRAASRWPDGPIRKAIEHSPWGEFAYAPDFT